MTTGRCCRSAASATAASIAYVCPRKPASINSFEAARASSSPTGTTRSPESTRFRQDMFVRAWTASMMVSALITTSMPRERASATRATTCSSSASSFESPRCRGPASPRDSACGGPLGLLGEHLVEDVPRPLPGLLGARLLTVLVVRQVLVQHLAAQLTLDRRGDVRGELPLAHPRPDRLGGPLRQRQAYPRRWPFPDAVRRLSHDPKRVKRVGKALRPAPGTRHRSRPPSRHNRSTVGMSRGDGR